MTKGQKNWSARLLRQIEALEEAEEKMDAAQDAAMPDPGAEPAAEEPKDGGDPVVVEDKHDDGRDQDGRYLFTIDLSGIRLRDNFAKAFFLFTRAKFKKWKYDDQLMGWTPEAVNKAIKDYKKFMLDVMLGITHGDLKPKGLLAKPEFLKLEDVFKSLRQQKYGDSRDVPSLLRKQVTTYMQMVFPFEKRIIFDLYQGGYMSTKGEMRNLEKAIKFLSLRSPANYKSEQEKELDADLNHTRSVSEPSDSAEV